ncbi:hypothetical protein GOP47_0017675 [Adiantum capillus-veneris]|uniref:Uncharacterized protein n=1 Tax=Adiantum capillus-veneris TaxID=13818 RepID=A0A9D4ZAT6_ADICA|nr:hypothetical protein GOP47_0017675 [Adiantum capillus-veneris]
MDWIFEDEESDGIEDYLETSTSEEDLDQEEEEQGFTHHDHIRSHWTLIVFFNGHIRRLSGLPFEQSAILYLDSLSMHSIHDYFTHVESYEISDHGSSRAQKTKKLGFFCSSQKSGSHIKT